MKFKFAKIFFVIAIFSQVTFAQNSAMTADPGTPPPPQGWQQPPPDAGIRAPHKTKRKLKLKMKSSDDKTPDANPPPVKGDE